MGMTNTENTTRQTLRAAEKVFLEKLAYLHFRQLDCMDDDLENVLAAEITKVRIQLELVYTLAAIDTRDA
jgi:hypothetical protein